ncbi:MAG: TonB-dependent receptor [Xanthomonadales bacterium]|nr:TonB-dependent receptor [Xanthomonadales bacterium]
MENKKYRRSTLSASIAFALGAFSFQPIMAQETEAELNEDTPMPMLEEVVVTGVRKSLIASMDRKRSAIGVVDAITAEDFGDFPDTNLAEALQRIPGVSIDRFNGEGSQITVRGLGPEFNLTLLNGRSMPSSGGRSFDFLDIATEGVSAVEVFKTSRAGLPTGGIGATVNLLTSRPLNTPGFRGVITAKALHETSVPSSSDLKKWTPEVSGLYSQTFADDTFGVLLSGSYSKRENREEEAHVSQWFENREVGSQAAITNDSQRTDGRTWYPQDAGYGFADNERERTNAQVALQWAPTDSFTATLDYTYAETEFTKNSNGFGIWFNGAGATVNGNINERGVFTQVTEAGGDYATGIARDHTKKKLDSWGINLDWQATDSLTFELDYHDSTSKTRGAGLGALPGSSANVIIGNSFDAPWCRGNPDYPADCGAADITNKSANYFGGGIPVFDMGFISPTGELQDELFASDIGSLFGQAFDDSTDNEIKQIQLSGIWEGDGGALQSIEFGFASTKQDFKTQNAYSGQLPAGFWLTSNTWWDDGTFTRDEYGNLLGDFGNSGNYPIDWYWTAPFDAVVDGYETVGGNDPNLGGADGVYWPSWGPDFQDGDRGRFWPGPVDGGSTLSEKVTSAFLQFIFADDFHGMPITARAGIRYEKAKVKSKGLETPATALVWIGGNEWIYEFAPEQVPSQGGGTTEYFLPSLDIDMSFKDDLIGRFSASRSIARPPIGDMSSTRNFVGNPKVGNRDVTVGNPELEPYVSDNFDLSLEWYYAPGSYVSVGYYYKIVDNFLVNTTVNRTYEGLTDAYIGPTAELARQQLADEGIVATDTRVFERMNEILGNDPGTFLTDLPGDPLAVFDASTVTNGERGKLHGWELQVQHLFGDSGFGVIGNATFVGGDVDVDREVDGRFFALGGLSDSANFQVFYENDTFAARLLYNWRDEFYNGGVNQGSPVFTEAYSQIDANFTWYASDNWTVFIEGYNLTNETQRTYARYPEMFLRGNQWGARYAIGASYRF